MTDSQTATLQPMSSDSPEHPHECDMCGLTFRTEEQLERHVHRDHETRV